MRLLFAHYGPFLTARGGGSKCDRQVIEALAHAGHECLVLIPGYGDDMQVFQRYTDKKNKILSLNGFAVLNVYNGCNLYANSFRREIKEAIKLHRPDYIIVTGTDHGHIILKTAIGSRIPVIYIPRCTWDLCWGENLPYSNITSKNLIRQCHRVYVHSDFMQTYLKKWFDVEAQKLLTVLPFSSELIGLKIKAPHDRKFVCGMINPSSIKGIDIFIGLAKSFQNINFIVVSGWATTFKDITRCESCANIQVVEQFDDPVSFYEKVDVLIVPSVWDEGFGCVVIEAMLSGVPVVASDIGGLPEAKRGLPYLIPVSPIKKYLNVLDERGIPVPFVPFQNLVPWISAVEKLVNNHFFYQNLAIESRLKAIEYNAMCSEYNVGGLCNTWL